jgi:hypothetical protein
MSVTFGAVGSAVQFTSSTSFSSVFNIGTLTNGALVVGVGFGGTSVSANSVSTCTWNGVNVPSITGASGWDGGGAGNLALLGLVSPANGSNTLAITLAGADSICLAFWSFSGVDQTGGATTFYNGQYSIGNGSQSSRTVAQATANGDATAALWALGGNSPFSGTPTFDFLQNPSFWYSGHHILSTGASDSYIANQSSLDWMEPAIVSIKAFAGAVVIDVPPNWRPRFFPARWFTNKLLLQNSSDSPPVVETNPHWAGRPLPRQWIVTGSLLQNQATDVPPPPLVEAPQSFVPRSLPVQWIINRALFQNTAQDLSSSAAETNPHWIGRTWPAQWIRTLNLSLNTADVPIVLPDVPPHWKPITWPAQWTRQPGLLQGTAQDTSSSAVETNTFFTPRMWRAQWKVNVALMQNTAQDFSFIPPVITGTHVFSTMGAKFIQSIGVS